MWALSGLRRPCQGAQECFLEDTWAEMTVVTQGGGDDPPNANPRARIGHQVCGPNPRTRLAWVKVGMASGTHEVCSELLNCVCEMRHAGTATSVSPSPQCYSKQVRGERGQSHAAGLRVFFQVLLCGGAFLCPAQRRNEGTAEQPSRRVFGSTLMLTISTVSDHLV